MFGFLTRENFSPKHSVFSIGIGAGRDELLLGCAYGTLLICDLSGCRVTKSLKMISKSPVTCVKFLSPCYYLCGTRDGEVRVWRLKGNELSTLYESLAASASFGTPLDFKTAAHKWFIVSAGAEDGLIILSDLERKNTLSVKCRAATVSSGNGYGVLMALVRLHTAASEIVIVACVYETHAAPVYVDIESPNSKLMPGLAFLSLPSSFGTATTATGVHNRLMIFGTSGRILMSKFSLNKGFTILREVDLIKQLGLQQHVHGQDFRCANTVLTLPDGTLIVAMWNGLLIQFDMVSLKVIAVSRHKQKPVQAMCVDDMEKPACLFVTNATDGDIGVFKVVLKDSR